MSRPEDFMGHDETFVQRALQALDAPPADRAFRDRLAAQFVAGTIEPGRFSTLAADELAGGDGDSEAVEAAADRSRARPRVLRGPWGRVRRIAIAAAAAAAAVTIVAGLNLGSDWRVVSSEGASVVVVDDRAIPVLHAEELAKRVRRGGRLRVQDGSLVVMAGSELMIEITPGTTVTLPSAPNRWWSREARARIETGECRITTGSGFHGAKLAIATPEAAVEVYGTTLAVIREPAGTCVCVFEGMVRVGRSGESGPPVSGGRRRFVFGDGRPVEDAAIRDTEIQKLRMFRDLRAQEAGE